MNTFKAAYLWQLKIATHFPGEGTDERACHAAKSTSAELRSPLTAKT